MDILRLSTLSLAIAIAVMTLGYANPSFADKPGSGECSITEHCHDDDEDKRDKTFYDVVIGPTTNTSHDDLSGESDIDHPWSTFGKGTSIGLNDSSIPNRTGVGEFTDLRFFHNLMGGSLPFTHTQGAECFPFPGTTAIHQGNVREGRGGRAQAGFFSMAPRTK